MEDNKHIKFIKKTIKSITILSYIQIALLLPLLFLHVLFILIIFANIPLIYYSRQLRIDLDELYDRAEKHMTYVAEDAFCDIIEHKGYVYVLSGVMAWFIFGILAYNLHSHPFVVYLLISIALYVILVILCVDLTPQKIIDSLNEPQEEYKPEDFQLKLPKERPLKEMYNSPVKYESYKFPKQHKDDKHRSLLSRSKFKPINIKRIMKYLAQILASIVYSYLYTAIMYLVIVLPLAYIVSLPWWGMLLVIFLAGGIIEGLTNLLGGIGSVPFFWIVKKNVVAKFISICVVVGSLGSYTFTMWKCLVGNGFWAIVLGIIVTIMMLQLAWVTYIRIDFAYYGAKDEIQL